MYVSCYKPCAQRAHTHILMYNFCWIIFPKFWQFISNKNLYFKNVHSPTLRRKGSQKPFNWHIFILIVGMIYPVQIYIFCNIYICIQICGIHASCIYILVLEISYQLLERFERALHWPWSTLPPWSKILNAQRTRLVLYQFIGTDQRVVFLQGLKDIFMPW